MKQMVAGTVIEGLFVREGIAFLLEKKDNFYLLIIHNLFLQ
jgi:hypothetical protein